MNIRPFLHWKIEWIYVFRKEVQMQSNRSRMIEAWNCSEEYSDFALQLLYNVDRCVACRLTLIDHNLGQPAGEMEWNAKVERPLRPEWKKNSCYAADAKPTLSSLHMTCSLSAVTSHLSSLLPLSPPPPLRLARSIASAFLSLSLSLSAPRSVLCFIPFAPVAPASEFPGLSIIESQVSWIAREKWRREIHSTFVSKQSTY